MLGSFDIRKFSYLSLKFDFALAYVFIRQGHSPRTSTKGATFEKAFIGRDAFDKFGDIHVI
jgi:hypothetical protein